MIIRNQEEVTTAVLAEVEESFAGLPLWRSVYRSREPVGVVACITSYNFPIVNMVGKIAPALAMGNTVVVRPAGQDPLAVIELVNLLHEVGFPEGVVNVVTGSTPATGEALVESPDVDMVSFTGSTGVGMRIGEVAGRTMKRQLLELGGKGAALVLDDADPRTAIGMISSVWSFHSGQICTAPTRAIVHRSIYDEVVAGLSAAAGRLTVGDPLERTTVVGPVITEAHRARIEGYIAAGREEGGTIVAGATGGGDGTAPGRGETSPGTWAEKLMSLGATAMPSCWNNWISSGVPRISST